MKIALGMKSREMPYGGGNQVFNMLSSFLINKGVKVVYDLKDKDIDIILLADPRPSSETSTFDLFGVIDYIKKVNSQALLVQRINECDERKGTKNVNVQLALANSIMDHTIYISSWLKDLFKSSNLKFSDNYIIIRNGGNESTFSYKKSVLAVGKKIKLVTHHWSPNKMKGWHIYSFIDSLLDRKECSSRIEFHYIGNAPADIKTKNIIFHPPCNGKELASLIKDCHIYLTASINEPAGMHHIEGALCGLPLLYINSGALPEYCGGYGVKFNGTEDFEEKLNELITNYDSYSSKMATYFFTSERMCTEYSEFFKDILSRKEQILFSRDSSKFGFLNLLKIKYLFFYFMTINRIGIY